MKTKQGNNVTNRTSAVYTENDNCHKRSNSVPTMTKSRQDNDVTNCIDVVYVEHETKLP